MSTNLLKALLDLDAQSPKLATEFSTRWSGSLGTETVRPERQHLGGRHDVLVLLILEDRVVDVVGAFEQHVGHAGLCRVHGGAQTRGPRTDDDNLKICSQSATRFYRSAGDEAAFPGRCPTPRPKVQNLPSEQSKR